MKTLINTTIGNKSLYKKLGNVFSRSSQHINVEEDKTVKQENELKHFTCPLTGLMNQAGLGNYFEQVVASNVKNARVILVEIDDFAALNQTYGNKVTNKVINSFVTEMNKTCRNKDIITRWSDKEFLFVLPETSLEYAIEITNKIRIFTQNTAWKKEVKITCSTAVFQLNGEEFHELVIKTQKELFRAKRSGNNRAYVAPPASTAPPVNAQKTHDINTSICPLTGILNRHGLSQFFDKTEPSALKRMSVIFVEIINFDSIAQQYGQLASDEVLKDFTNEINLLRRNCDTLATWSTNEYLLVCPSTNIYRARNVAEEIQLAIQNKTWLKGIQLACNIEIYDEACNDLTAHYPNTRPSSIEASKLTKPEIDYAAMTCPLTGALNQAGLQNYFELIPLSEIEKMSVIFMEIDNFERITEQYGKHVSENVLQKLSSEVSNLCSNKDILARWSANEYLLICPNTTLESAVKMAEIMALTIENKTWLQGVQFNLSTEVYDKDWIGISSKTSKTPDKDFSINNISAA